MNLVLFSIKSDVHAICKKNNFRDSSFFLRLESLPECFYHFPEPVEVEYSECRVCQKICPEQKFGNTVRASTPCREHVLSKAPSLVRTPNKTTSEES